MDATHILVPLSGTALSERALGVAAALGDRFHLPLRLLSLVRDPSELGFQRRYLVEQQSALRRDHRHRLVDVEAACEDSMTEGLLARWCQAGLLVMATSADIYRGDHYVGSAAEAIVRSSGRPAVLVGPSCVAGAGFSPGRVVVAVDGSPESESALVDGQRWAERLGLPLKVVTVLDQSTTEAFAADGQDTAEKMAARYLAGLADDWEVLRSADAATALVAAYGEDALLVMSTHGRSGLSRMALGSVATDVCRMSSQPVVVRRPPQHGEDDGEVSR